MSYGLEAAKTDHVFTIFLTVIKLAVISQARLGNKYMNIKTIENS